jgi:hypothetical protein
VENAMHEFSEAMYHREQLSIRIGRRTTHHPFRHVRPVRERGKHVRQHAPDGKTDEDAPVSVRRAKQPRKRPERHKALFAASVAIVTWLQYQSGRAMTKAMLNQ